MYYFLLLLLWLIVPVNPDSFLSAESRLMHNLFIKSGYDPAVRPVKKASTKINLTLGIQLVSILDLDVKQEQLVSIIWLTQKWIDEFLTWDPEDYEDIEHLRLPSERIWNPDIIVLEKLKDRDTASAQTHTAIISSEGEVLLVPWMQLRTECDLDTRYFPFDSQLCTITFMTWAHGGNQIVMQLDNYTEPHDILNEFREGQFRVFEAKIWRTRFDTHAIKAQFGIARRPLHYIYTLLGPCVLLSALSLIVFRLSADSGEKIALGVTMLLVLHVLLSNVGEQMPESATTIPLIAIYISSVMALNSFSIVMSVVVINIHSQGTEQQVPDWMRNLFVGKLAAIIGIKGANKFKTSHKRHRQAIRDLIGGQLANDDVIQLLLRNEYEKKELQDTSDEWKMLAKVIDRLLFYVMSLVVVIITVALLVVIPMCVWEKSILK